MDTISEWKKKRAGIPTSSKWSILLPKTGFFTKTAITYLYQLKRERRLNAPLYERSNYNFDFGHENEPMAINWLKANTKHDIKHCSNSFDFPEIYFAISKNGTGDSPDFFADGHIVGEIKCPVDRVKFEQILDLSKDDVKAEYEHQFANHFNCNPKCDTLLYCIYDAMNDDDEFDIVDPLDASRGIIHYFYRWEFEPLIQKIEDHAKIVNDFLDLVMGGKYKVSQINEYYKEVKK